MHQIIAILIFTLLINLTPSYGQGLSCTYTSNTEYGYACFLTIFNPNGFNNFTIISGTHLEGFSDQDVNYIIRTVGSNSINIPSIICNQFSNSRIINLQSIGIERIDPNTFDGCGQLTQLWLHTNKISHFPNTIFDSLITLEDLAISSNRLGNISIEWFKNLENLKILYLNVNQLEEIPTNAFNSLKNLSELFLHGNQLTIIHSESFGTLPNLRYINFSYNKINAIDERVIDITGVNSIDLQHNICASIYVFDGSDSREVMRNELRDCFNNYKDLFPETTTIQPPTTQNTPTTTIPSTVTTETTTIQPPTTHTTPTTTISSTVTTTSEEPTTMRPTLPPGCIGGNLDERVCRIEDRVDKIEENINFLNEENVNINKTLEDQTSEINELREKNRNLELMAIDMQEQIEILKKEKQEMQENMETQNKVFITAIENLENKVVELSNRPCACR